MDPLPCPWCGDKPTVVTQNSRGGAMKIVCCKSARCSVNPKTHPCTYDGEPRKTRQEAITAWNSRK